MKKLEALFAATMACLALACGSSDSGSTATGGSGGAAAGGSGGSSGGSGDSGTTGGAGGSGGAGASGGASTDGGGALCPGLGWCEITDTKLESVCSDDPSVHGIVGCAAVIAAWSGGVADTLNNRLIVWGGGHADYYGNEVYALDLESLKMQRLDNPGPSAPQDSGVCGPEALSDGTPNSRHTYDGLAFIDQAPGRMFAFGGALASNNGCLGNATWILDLDKLAATQDPTQAWSNVDPGQSSLHSAPGAVADYDSQGGRVILDDTYSLFAYDVASNSYTTLSDNGGLDYHMTGRVDPKRHLVFAMGGDPPGGGIKVFDLAGSNHDVQDWTSQFAGCDAVATAAYPGLAYDSKQDKMVAWAGGDDVYVLDLDAKTCTKQTFAGGPGDQQQNGTMGRFRYFPALGVFALVNDWQQNAFALRLAN